MKIHIKGGRLVDPQNGVDRRAGSSIIAAGKIAASASAPKGFSANRTIDASGLVVCPGCRPRGAPARAGLRVQGDARIRDGGGGRGRRHEPRLPARHRSAARRAGPGRDAQVRRARALNRRARLSDRRAHAGAEGRAADRDGRAARRRLRRVLAGRGRRLPTTRCSMPRAAVRVDVRLRGVAAPAGPAPARRRRRARRRGRDAARPARRSRSLRRNGRARARSCCSRARPARACTSAACRARDGVDMVRAREARRPAAHLRRRRPSRASLRDGHRLLRCATATSCRRSAASATATRCARALADGTIDAVCSDHTPVDEDAKQLPFGEAEPGATGLELLLPLTLKWAGKRACRSSAALAQITSDPARILGIDAGHLGAGRAADVCIFDPGAATGRSRPPRSRSQGKNTPFLGYELPGGCATRSSTARCRFERGSAARSRGAGRSTPDPRRSCS